MRLIEISYSEFVGEPRYWRLHPIQFQQVNLIVGRNASGKSRTLAVINALAQSLTGLREAPADGMFDLKFTSNGDVWRYILHVLDGQVKVEKFLKNEVSLLDRREGGFGDIFAVELESTLAFQTPTSMLAATTRLDMVQHPFLAPLIDWAKGLFFYPCHTELGKQTVLLVRTTSSASLNLKDSNQTAAVLRQGKQEFGSAFDEAVIRDMKKVGYPLMEIGISTPTTVQISGIGDINSIYVVEEGIPAQVDQFSMSVGMFRALAIVIHLNYGMSSNNAQCVLIDDIGEGLDFDRSSNLIKLVVDKAQASEMQIIMTTNDRYVMNGVDLDYWNVLHRNGPEVMAFNSRNRPEDFEEFKFTGLSNFDFLARDFLSSAKP